MNAYRPQKRNQMILWIKAHPFLMIGIVVLIMMLGHIIETTFIDPSIAHAETKKAVNCMTNKECCEFYNQGSFINKDVRITKLCDEINGL